MTNCLDLFPCFARRFLAETCEAFPEERRRAMWSMARRPSV